MQAHGTFDQGKLLYEKGGLSLDNLSEESVVTVEEDYQACVRPLARSGEPKRSSRRENAKGRQKTLFD